MNNLNHMGYIVPFLTISSILIDICFYRLIFIGAMFNSYNYWYLLSYSNQFTLHYSILFLIISIMIISLIYCFFRCYIKFSFYNPISGLIHCIISPCNIAINLNTPCVAGCCGLKLIILNVLIHHAAIIPTLHAIIPTIHAIIHI